MRPDDEEIEAGACLVCVQKDRVINRLQAEVEHYLRCRDLFTCIDDTGPQEMWIGCSGHIEKALSK